MVDEFRLNDASSDMVPSYMKLEERVKRFIKFISLGTPIAMLGDELLLIIKSLDEIKNC